MTRTRARADERNEKTKEVLKERARITPADLRKLNDRELKDLMDSRSPAAIAVHGDAEIILQEREEKADRKRLADLLDRLAEFVGDDGGALEYGEGKSWTLVTDEDLLRIAELIDPDD